MNSRSQPRAQHPDLTRVRPYGDTLDDGMVQLSFSLPVPWGPEAVETARRMVVAMGLLEPQIYHGDDLGDGYAYFIVYAKTRATVDFTQVEVPRVAAPRLDRKGVEALVEERVGREIVILGACTGTDAHTVGIDAIMNLKGYDGEKGLEAYRGMDARNLGAQVANEELIEAAIAANADALLVSQVVTQKDVHRTNLTELVDMLEAAGLRDSLVVLAGGPRIGHELALELGYDAGFGPGTRPPEVASFVVQQLIDRELVVRPPLTRR